MFSLLRLLAAVSLLTCLSASAASEWQNLFNGHDLSGWRQVTGTAPFRVVGDTIEGETVPKSPNSFLATEALYDDFELEFEVRLEVDRTFNSGVQFRSAVRDEKGKPRVYGYQCEIDPSSRGWSAGLYDEAGRAWLYPVTLNPPALSQFKVGEWNKYRLQVCGKELRTWLNGVPVAYVIDEAFPTGFIALQVHSINKEEEVGRKVAWRNLRLRKITAQDMDRVFDGYVRNLVKNHVSPVEASQGWRLLWNGQDASGWRAAKGTSFPSAGWEMKEGVLTVLESGGAESQSGGDIVTELQYAAFELQLEFQFTEGANSGIKYFVQPELNKGAGSAIGLEYQILDDERHPDAKLGRDGNRTLASLYDLKTAAADKPKVKPGEWHHARIVAKGAQVEHWLDGRKVLDYDRSTAAFRELVAISKYKIWPGFGEWPAGHLLLQDHGNRVSFHSIKLRQLPNSF